MNFKVRAGEWTLLEISKLLVPICVVVIGSLVAKKYFDGIEKSRSDLANSRILAEYVYGWLSPALRLNEAIVRYQEAAQDSETSADAIRFLWGDIESRLTDHRESAALWSRNLQANRIRIRDILSDGGSRTEYEDLFIVKLNNLIRASDACLLNRYISIIGSTDAPPCSSLLREALSCGEYITNTLAQLVTEPDQVNDSIANATSACGSLSEAPSEPIDPENDDRTAA